MFVSNERSGDSPHATSSVVQQINCASERRSSIGDVLGEAGEVNSFGKIGGVRSRLDESQQ